MGDKRGPNPLACYRGLERAVQKIGAARITPMLTSCRKGARHMPELADLLLYGGAALLGVVLISKILPRAKSDRQKRD